MSMATFNQFHSMEIDELNEFMRDVLGLEGLESTDELQNPDVKSRFAITDVDQLNWVMRKLAALKAQKQEAEALAKLEKERIETWKNRQTKAADQSTAFFEALIEDWANAQRAADPKFKTKSTPYGRVTFTKQQPEWKYPDEAMAVEFLQTLPEELGAAEHIKIEKTIADKTKFKKAMEIKRNVFVEYSENSEHGIIIDYGTANEETGEIKGMEFAVQGDNVVLLESGEFVENVVYMAAAVVVDGNSVVPGIEVADRPESVAVKPEV